MTRTEMILETLDYSPLKHLKQLLAFEYEYFIKFIRMYR